MVSSPQRHLSLFLVFVMMGLLALAGDGLPLPIQQANAQEETLVEDVLSDEEIEAVGADPRSVVVTGGTETEKACNRSGALDARAELFNRGSKIIAYRNLCFLKEGATLYHLFKDTGTGKIYAAPYKLRTDIVALGGCVIVSSECNEKTPLKYRHFSIKQAFHPTAKSFGPMEVYTIDGISESARQNAILIAHPEGIFYGFHFKGATDTYIKLTPTSQEGGLANSNAAVLHYMSQVNGLNGGGPPYLLSNKTFNVSNLNDRERAESVKAAVQQVFGLVAKKDLKLEDDLAKSSKASLELTPPAPDSPPLLIVSKEALGVITNKDVVFKLTADNRVASGFLGLLKNNYFIFKFVDASDEIKSALVEPERVFVGIDINGNVAFLVEDKSIDGGMFASNKDKLDSFWAVGSFDHTKIESSHNLRSPRKDVLSIDLGMYREKITRRVYNDANTSGTGGDKCGKVTEYPNLNNTYIKDNGFPNDIPDKDHRECLNISAGSWLRKWQINDQQLDTSGDDTCVGSFRPSFFGTLVVKPLCAMLAIATGWSVGLAKYSVDFLIEAVGLQ